MTKPTEKTDWATDPSALVTPTDSSRWDFGWSTPGNDPTGIGEKPNLNQQNYWQNAVHKWFEYIQNPGPLVPTHTSVATSNSTLAIDTWFPTHYPTLNIDVVAGQVYNFWAVSTQALDWNTFNASTLFTSQSKFIIDAVDVPVDPSIYSFSSSVDPLSLKGATMLNELQYTPLTTKTIQLQVGLKWTMNTGSLSTYPFYGAAGIVPNSTIYVYDNADLVTRAYAGISTKNGLVPGGFTSGGTPFPELNGHSVTTFSEYIET